MLEPGKFAIRGHFAGSPVSFVFILISQLLADPSNTALSRGYPGITLYHWESSQPFLNSIIITYRERLTSLYVVLRGTHLGTSH